MSSSVKATPGQDDLRSRATTRLTGHTHPQGIPASASAALGVLHELASSPATAADALALLHELQVHQVELELQAEELRNSRAELETALGRQIQLYDHAPAGCCTIARNTVLQELNLRAANWLGADREQLLGQRLDSFLTPADGQLLHAMLERISAGSQAQEGVLHWMAPGAPAGSASAVQASVSADPAGPHFLLAGVKIGGTDPSQTA